MSNVNTSHLSSDDLASLRDLLKVQPIWYSNRLARDAIGLKETTFLHAGPPFESVDQIPQPVLNSAYSAAVFEGIAKNFEEAKELVSNETIRFEPAQDLQVVIPLAGIVSASMWLHEVIDASGTIDSPRAYTPFNGGNGPAMRLGLCNDDVVAHLKWINSELAEALDYSLPNNLSLVEIADEALRQGDDCHGRTIVGTKLLIESLLPKISEFPDVLWFLEEGPSFFLNLWMAACKSMLVGLTTYSDSSVVISAAGNGSRVGFQMACKPSKWYTCEANAPTGKLGTFSTSRALGAIGDSAVVDLLGFGAMAFTYAPEQKKLFRDYLPKDAADLPTQLLTYRNLGFKSMNLNSGLCVRTIIEMQTTPIVSLGIIDNAGSMGRLGGGIYRYPIELFDNDEVLAELDKAS